MSDLVSLDVIKAAADRIRGVAKLTPLLKVQLLNSETTIKLKCENFQAIGAFKFRGAYNMVSQLSPNEQKRGVITYSSGNHAQAVALAGKLVDAPVVVVMPTTAPEIKVEGVKELGARVIFEGTTSADRKNRAEVEAQTEGLTIVPPFDHPAIIAGQGTAGLEIMDQCVDVTTVFVPIGGGGMAAGASAAIKQIKPSVRIIGVEPDGAARMGKSIDAGSLITLPTATSIADGLLPLRAGDLTFAHAQAFVDEFVTVADREIAQAVVWLHRRAKLVVEPSGATAFAAVLNRAAEGQFSSSERVVAILTGGNMAPETLMKCVALAG
jgi:threonine dehydratase